MADWYVDPAKANDDGDATSRATARKTIQSVIGLIRTNGNAADTINLMQGTYNDGTQGAAWKMFFSNPTTTGKVTTIKKDPEAAGTITITPTHVYAFGVLFSDPLKHIIVENITIDSSTPNNCLEINADLGTQVTFDNCVISTGSKALVFGSTDTTHSRFLKFTDCTITCGAASPLNVHTAELIEFNGGSFDKSSTSVGQLIFSAGIIDTVFIKGVTFASKKSVIKFNQTDQVIRNLFVLGNTFNMDPTGNSIPCVSIQSNVFVTTVIVDGNTFAYIGSTDPTAILAGSTASTYTNKIISPRITNNTFTHTRGNYYGRAIRIGAGVFSAVITGNNASDFEDFVFNNGYGTIIIGNTVRVTNGVKNWGNGGSFVYHNSFKSVDGHNTARCIVMGRLNFAEATAADTTFTSTTVVDGNGTPWSGDGANVTAGLSEGAHLLALAKTGGVAQYNPDHWGIVTAISGGTVTVDQWFKADGSGDKETPDAGDEVMITEYGEQNSIFNNILDASQASDTITFDFNPRDGRDYVDYNCYNISNNLSNLGEGVQTTLLQLQTKWATWSTVFPLNDENSISDDPRFIDVDNGDFRLKRSSPCRNSGVPSIGGDDIAFNGYSFIGAWQAKVPTPRGIYSDGANSIYVE